MNELPTAVKKQEAEAEAALEAMIKERSMADEAVESAAETASNTQDTLTEAQPQPTPAAEPKADGVPQGETKTGDENTVSKQEFEKLQARLNVLQGKYNSELPRLIERAKELEAQNDRLMDELDQEKAKKPLELDDALVRKYLSEEEIEGLDPEVVDFQKRMARGVSEAVSDRRAQELERKVKSFEDIIADLRSSQAAAQDAVFWSQADKLAPGVATANQEEDAEWIEFLGKTEPVSRLTYRQLGEAAIERGDPAAVANLYSQMKALNPDDPPSAPRKSPAEQVKPETAPSAPRTDARPSGPVIRESEIAAFYNRAARDRLPAAQIAAKEAEFDQAASEGRIAFGK